MARNSKKNTAKQKPEYREGDMRKYFENTGQKGAVYLQPDGRRIDLRLGSLPKDSYELYKTGRHQWLGLKTEASELLIKEPLSVLTKLKERAESREVKKDVSVLNSVIKEKTKTTKKK